MIPRAYEDKNWMPTILTVKQRRVFLTPNFPLPAFCPLSRPGFALKTLKEFASGKMEAGSESFVSAFPLTSALKKMRQNSSL